MTNLVTFDASVPAFLRNANFLQLNQKAVQGLSSGSPPRLSYRGSRLRFVAADGTETPVTENNGVAIDVVVVDASEHVSKFYYDKAYDPNADDMSPACFSDNGQGPSARASKPQSLLCGNCPKNAWGSKVTPQGSQVKVCSDLKKLAIVPVNNITGPAYMLTIPGASLKTWSAFVDTVSKRGIPIPTLVVQIGFDATAEYPKLTFNPTRYINEQEAAGVTDLFGSEECDELVGRKDTPITALPNANNAVYAGGGAGSTSFAAASGGGAAQTVFTPPAAQPAPAFLQPLTHSQASAVVSAVGQADTVPTRRRRRTAAEMAEARAEPTPQAAQPPAGFAQPAPAAAQAVGPADLNALLDKVMGSK